MMPNRYQRLVEIDLAVAAFCGGAFLLAFALWLLSFYPTASSMGRSTVTEFWLAEAALDLASVLLVAHSVMTIRKARREHREFLGRLRRASQLGEGTQQR